MVEKLAHLARLQFQESEKQEIKNDLQRMIVFVEKLKELNLEGVEPLLHMSDEVNVLREDEVKGLCQPGGSIEKCTLCTMNNFLKCQKLSKP